MSPNPLPTEMPLGCAVCGEVTRHLEPYAGAPLSRWRCEHADRHAFVLARLHSLAAGPPLRPRRARWLN